MNYNIAIQLQKSNYFRLQKSSCHIMKLVQFNMTCVSHLHIENIKKKLLKRYFVALHDDQKQPSQICYSIIFRPFHERVIKFDQVCVCKEIRQIFIKIPQQYKSDGIVFLNWFDILSSIIEKCLHVKIWRMVFTASSFFWRV